jgi:hypothetical protein
VTEYRAYLVFEAPTATNLRQFLIKKTWAPTTKFTALVTIIAEMTRRGTPVMGDTKGLVRQFKKELYAYRPLRAQLATLPEVEAMMLTTENPELIALLGLMWTAAARLTSIASLRPTDVKMSTSDSTSVRLLAMTFREGKTILSTRPYTIHTQIPSRVASAIEHLQASASTRLFPRTPAAYYKALRPILQRHSLTIKSLRRGALTALAIAGVSPEQLLLLSRHTSRAGLYAYLDDGLYAMWEATQTVQLGHMLWTQ